MDKLDHIMETRMYEEPHLDLAQRIIDASRAVEQRKTIWSTLRGLCAELHMPQPVYTFASVLLFGFIMGFAFQINVLSQEDDIGELFYNDEGIL